ncbi:concanavalin A-like lectin/glucanase domain-containing protein [Gigaspora rosea]|uniref:Concanavalin A-like lectin/glucanase domain-containing protein n=1 Tax=Gigaspora rosea TaxID=44941 RepID=A0A397UJW2_9GLOM|nr:concanavalin A-like lectin/glucanase domain-containing protein [Gigaspora rosea]
MNSLAHVNPQFKWSNNDKSKNLEVEADDLMVNCKNESENFVGSAIRTCEPISKKYGLFYFEVTIKDKGKTGIIGIGFCTKTVKLDRMPGYEKNSWGYRSDNGKVYSCSGSGERYGPSFITGDIIGCCVNFKSNTAFFTKNGEHLGIAFSELNNEEKLYPCVGLKSEGGSLEANFGLKEFKYQAMNDDDPWATIEADNQNIKIRR